MLPPAARTRPHVDHPIGLGHRAHIVFDHHYGIAGIDQALQLHQQPVGVRRMQPGSRLVEHVQASAALAALKLGRQLDALRLATGKLSGWLSQAQIAQSDVAQQLQGLATASSPAKNSLASSTVICSTSAMLRPFHCTFSVASL